MATADEPIDPNRQECPNRCDLGDRFYIKEPIAWVTCIITRPRDKLEHREKFNGVGILIYIFIKGYI